MRRDQSASRVAALRGRLVDLELDGVVITTPENIRYLSGFSGSLGYLVIGRTDAEILGDSRYRLQMEAEAPGFRLVRSGPSHGLWPLVAERLKALGLLRVGFESQHLTFDQHQRLSAGLPPEGTLVATAGLVEELRIVKAPEEVELLRSVAGIAGRAFDRVRGAIRPGLRERDVAFLLEQTFRELGADGPAFETIVAAGERGALPHGRASDRGLERGDMVVVDFGATAAGYHSDTTRTIVVGEPSTEQARVIEAVRQAHLASMDLMNPGGAADALVVDPGLQVDRVLGRVRQDGLTVERILVTHGHIDHVGGVPRMHAETGAPVAMHPDDLAILDWDRYGHLPNLPSGFGPFTIDT